MGVGKYLEDFKSISCGNFTLVWNKSQLTFEIIHEYDDNKGSYRRTLDNLSFRDLEILRGIFGDIILNA